MTAESTLRKAKKLARHGDVGQAIVVCETFLRKFPKDGRIRQHVRTLTASQIVGATLPDDQRALLDRAFKRGAFSELVPKVIQLIQHYPKSYYLWNLQGTAHLQLNNLQKAEQAFLKATQIDPMAAAAFVGLGDLQKSCQQTNAPSHSI